MSILRRCRGGSSLNSRSAHSIRGSSAAATMLSFADAELNAVAPEDCLALQSTKTHDSRKNADKAHSKWASVTPVVGERTSVEWKLLSKDLLAQGLDLDTETATECHLDARSKLDALVQKVERQLFEKNLDKEYSCLEGTEEFRAAAGALLLGKDHPALTEGRVATVQSLAETGALRLAAAFIQRFFPEKAVYVSNPTEKTPKAVFADAGVQWKPYRYLNTDTHVLDFDGMIADLTDAPDGSVILLNGCGCHMSGVDLTTEQWKAICDLCASKDHLPILDLAHQGLASGSLEADAQTLQQFVNQGLEVVVLQSFAHNLALSDHCIGAVHFIVRDSDLASRVQSQLKLLSRALYAFAPVHGSRIVTKIADDAEFLTEWNTGLNSVMTCAQEIRQKLQSHLMKQFPVKDWSFLARQTGTFACLGLTSDQVLALQRDDRIVMSENGCIALSALPLAKVEYLANAIAKRLFVCSAED